MRIPSHDTFGRVFARLDPKQFEECFLNWVRSLLEKLTGVIAIDGKTLRRSHDAANGKKALHMVSAWAVENLLVLAQVAVDEKSNEITAIPELLHLLVLEGCIVTIDAIGYDAKLLPQVCDAYLQAREAHQALLLLEGRRLLTEDQERIAAACEVLIRGLAQVGIVALIDEATGYQAEREKDELSRILAAYINEELRPWIKKFPDEFFRQIYRLYRWQYTPGNTQSPRYIGKLINKWIYEQLPPGVLPALQEKNPVTGKGYRRYKNFQFLTEPTA